MQYYEVRPIVLAVLALAAVQDAASKGEKTPNYEGIMRRALTMEDAMFSEVSKVQRRSSFPQGKYVG